MDFEFTPGLAEALRDRFKADRSFAEQFFRLITEKEETTVTDIWTKAHLPQMPDNDPDALIVKMEGTCGEERAILAFLTSQDDPEMMPWLETAYVAWLWEPYHPVTDEDFEHLPRLYITDLRTETETDEAILHVRTMLYGLDTDGSKKPIREIDDGVYINLINVGATDSEIMALLKSAAGGAIDAES